MKSLRTRIYVGISHSINIESKPIKSMNDWLIAAVKLVSDANNFDSFTYYKPLECKLAL